LPTTGTTLTEPVPRLLSSSEPARHCIVYLVGRGDHPRAFSQNGLLDILSDKGISSDVIEVNSHFGYYANRSLLERLNQDIFPAIETRSYEKTLFVGNSLGGLGSLLYAQEHPDRVDAIVLMGPYLGNERVIREITEAGGVAAWEGPVEPGKADWQRQLWLWIKKVTTLDEPGPDIYLIYGNTDRFKAGHALLAAVLPKGRVWEVDGGHDWDAWRAGWSTFIETDAAQLASAGGTSE